MYFVAPEKSSSGTRPPCFWNCGTAAGEVLKTRHGALPAVMAAPMTSSEDLPAGISWAVTFWLGFLAFQSVTIALPQARSSGLFDSQILIGTLTARSPPPPDEEPPPLPPPQAVAPRARASKVAAAAVRFIGAPFRGGPARGVREGVQWRPGRRGTAAGARRSVLPFLDGGHQAHCRCLSPGVGIGADSGERGLEVRADLGVVEPGEGQVARHVEAAARSHCHAG